VAIISESERGKYLARICPFNFKLNVLCIVSTIQYIFGGEKLKEDKKEEND